MFMKKILFAFTLIALVSVGCVSKKKYNAEVSKNVLLNDSLNRITNQLDVCLSDKQAQRNEIKRLEAELISLRANANNLMGQLEDLSIISKAQAESIKQSLQNISSKDSYIKDLQSAMARKDSLNMQLVLSLKGALKDINDKDVEIKVEGSAVFVDISDKLLFKQNSFEVEGGALKVLEKVATVLKAQKDITFMVEGHTDNIPMNGKILEDNWDLSVLRATAVVRLLQTKYGLDPSRLIAAGRAEHKPVTANDTEDGRARNRRTRIVILPQLDQFFKLIEPKK
jgi:chemotaxis protein MotB